MFAHLSRRTTVPGLLALATTAALTLAPTAGRSAPPGSGSSPSTGVATRAPDRCASTSDLTTGTRAGGFYRSLSPFEHHDSARSQVFSAACSLHELPPGDAVAAVRAVGDYATPYTIATRDRDELVVYGYDSDAEEGAYVALLDARTLTERWRVAVPDRSPSGQWSYPGVAAVLGDGAVVAVYGNQLVRLAAADGRVQARRSLPEDPDGTGAAYNGFVALPGGPLVLKSIERGPCPTQATPEGPASFVESIGGLVCSSRNGLPTTLLTVDPVTLRTLDRVTTPEPVTGRVTATRRRGVDLVYVAGRDSLHRYRVRPGGDLVRDRGWGPVRYRTGDGTPGTGPGLLGRWVVVQTNFLPSTEALRLTAVHQDDPTRVFHLRPFAGRLPLGAGTLPVVDALAPLLGDALAAAPAATSWIVSKPALDRAARTIVTHDTAVGEIAAVHLDPRSGLSVRWSRPLRSLSFTALTGPPRCRDVVQTDWRPESGDQVVWLDLATGEELRRTGTLDQLPAPGNVVTPGYDGTFFYAGLGGGLFALRPGGTAPPAGGCRR